MAAARRGIAVWVAAAAASLTTAQSEPELARVACDAKHNTPCARTNSEFLAWDTARQFTEQVAAGASADDVLRQITDGDFNIASGFYPFVFDAATSELLAHGERSTLVGQQLPQVFEGLNLQYSDPQLLHDRFVAAANTPDGDWVQYLWPTQTRDGSFMATSKQSYVVGINRGIGGPLLCLGVGFADTPLPLQLPCSDKYDTLCATNNVRSLVGNAQTLLSKADSRANFEEYLLQLSYDVDEFQVPGGFYIFTYSFDGPLVSHARLHQMFGMNLAEIFSALDRSEDGDQLHQDFIAAAQGAGDGWVRYQWRNSLEEEPYTKIAYVVKVDFGGTSYYIGAGFNFVMAPAMAGPLAEVCPVAYNFPCAVTNTLQLSSHAVAHVISSAEDPETTFRHISEDPSGMFKTGSFYVFFYDYEDATVVAHGARSDFVGMTLTEVFEMVNIPLDADALHAQFVAAAQAGGGWVEYEWTNPNVPGSSFQKVAYIFKYVRDGVQYYGGVGFNHEMAEPVQYLAEGTSKSGLLVQCTPRFGTNCSETNSLRILGQGLGDLLIAVSDQGTRSKEEVFENITAKKYNYLDYSISVYEVDQRDPACVDREGFSPDGSGCCVAHGGNPSWVGKSWKQILEEQGVQSIIPTELHQRLATQANAGGGWEEYSWATDESAHQTKRAWASRFSSDNHEFYVVVEYFTTKAPPTCNECEDDKTPLCKGLSDDTCDTYMRCENDDQEFCAAYMPEELPGWAIPLFAGVGFFVLLAICGFRQQLQKRNRDIKDALADARIESERSMKKALDEQNQMHELQKKHMVFPVNWHIASEEKIEVDGKEVTVRIPDEGLVDVSPTTAEYWDVYDRLTAKPNPDFARPGPKTGLMSDLDGLSDTWITKLERIQNSDLYTWHDSVKQKLKTSSESANVEADTLDDQGQVKEVLGWHGTGSFDARSIYEDHQDGFMMQFASSGQWGRGLYLLRSTLTNTITWYFAEDAAYSHYYASKAEWHEHTRAKGMKDDEAEMMLTNLLVGNSIEIDRDKDRETAVMCKALKTPPAIADVACASKPAAEDGARVYQQQHVGKEWGGTKFNTVQGYTQADKKDKDGMWTKDAQCPRSKVWIVYENGRAYPQYLVRYYRGAYDRKRVPYQTREEAGVSDDDAGFRRLWSRGKIKIEPDEGIPAP